MAQKGTIQARLNLDIKAYKTSLADALKDAKTFRASLKNELKIPVIPPLPRAPRGGVDPALKQQREEIRGIANNVNVLKVEYEQGKRSQAEFVAGMKLAVTSAENLRKGFSTTSAEYGRLTNVIGIGARSITTANGETSRLGISQQVALGSTRNLTAGLTGLNQAVLPLIGVAGLGGLLRITGDLATQANRVNVAQDILNLTLDRTGQSSEGASTAISNVSKELGLAEGQITDSITQLVRVGFTTEQAQQALIAGGASALAFGKTASQGVESVTGALVTQNSALLNTIGIAENIGQAMSKAASDNAQYGEAAANSAAAQAGLDTILKATVSEVDSLGKLTGGLAGAQNEAATAAFNFRQEAGELLIPLETLKNEALAGVLDAFGSLPSASQAGVASFGAVTLGVSGLTTGLTALRPLLAATFLPPAGAIVIGIAVLAGLATGLVALAQAAKENVTPFKTIRENVDLTQKAIGKAGDKAALAGALESLSKQLDGDAKESVKNYAAEIRNAKGDVDELKNSASDLVTKVALSKALADKAGILTKLQTVPATQDADPNQIVADLQDRLNRSAEVQELGVQFKLGIENKDGQLAVKFLDDIQQRATLSSEAADLLARSLSETNTAINTVGEGASTVLRGQLTGLNTYIVELKKAQAEAAKPTKPNGPGAPTNPVGPLVDDAEARLKEVQSLREKIEAAGESLNQAQASAESNILKRLKLEQTQGAREIIGRTNRLITEVQGAFDRGLITQDEAQTQVTELQRVGLAELNLNDKQYTDAVAEEQQRRKQVLLDAQKATNEARIAEQAKTDEALKQADQALTDATLANIDGGIPQLNAAFKQQREARQDALEAQLQDFTGNASERGELLKTFNRTELQLGLTHNQTVNAQERTALESYLTTVRDYQEQVAAARQKARQDEIANAQALNTARAASAQGQIDAGDTSGYTALIAVQQDAVRIAKELTQASRERGASASEIVTALSAEAEAQRGVTGALESQIDALESLRDEQQQVITNGSAVLEYARNAAEISGQSLDYDSAGDAIQAEERAQYDLLQAAIAANAPFEERAELMNQLAQTQQTLNDLGQSSGLSSDERSLIGEQGDAQLDAYPAQAAEALKQIKSLDDQIADLGGTLEAATGELQTLLEAAGSDKGLTLKVKAEIDKGALAQAEQALRDTFGAGAASRIISEAQNTGTRAGRGLLTAFTSGIRTNQPVLLSEVDRLLQQVRNRFPSSDAKIGPLSDLTYSGGKLTSTFAAGMLKQRPALASAANMIAATAKPAFTVPSIPTSRPLSFPGAAGGAGGITNHFQLAIDGRNGAPVTGMLSMSARALAKDVQRELRVGGV